MRQVIQTSKADMRAAASSNMSRYTGAISETLLIGLLGIIAAVVAAILDAPMAFCFIAALLVAAAAVGYLIYRIRKIDEREADAEKILITEERRQNQHLRAMDMAKQEQETTIKLAEIQNDQRYAQLVGFLRANAPELAAALMASQRLPAPPQPAKPAQRKVYATLASGLQSPVFDYVAMCQMLTAQVQYGTVRNIATVDGQERPFAHDNSQESALRQIALEMKGTPLVKVAGKYAILPNHTVDTVLAWLDREVHDAN